uniref:Uncharacterized protein n=1 Tax=Glossina palpalis gambiensis TaxID=67801 RepID=A0A1B0ALY4_9MUSC
MYTHARNIKTYVVRHQIYFAVFSNWGRKQCCNLPRRFKNVFEDTTLCGIQAMRVTIRPKDIGEHT